MSEFEDFIRAELPLRQILYIDAFDPSSTGKFATIGSYFLDSSDNYKRWEKTGENNTDWTEVGTGSTGGGGTGGSGASNLDALTDVVTSGALDGYVLVYNSANSRWEPGIQSSSLSALNDVSISSPTDGSALVYNTVSGQWEVGLAASSLNSLTDVVTADTVDGNILIYDAISGLWTSQAQPERTLVSLTDTPTGFIGDGGKYLIVDPTNESKIIVGQPPGTTNNAYVTTYRSATGTSHSINCSLYQDNILSKAYVGTQQPGVTASYTQQDLSYGHAMVLPHNARVRQVTFRSECLSAASVDVTVGIHTNYLVSSPDAQDYIYFPTEPLETATQTLTAHQTHTFEFSISAIIGQGSTFGISVESDAVLGNCAMTAVLEYYDYVSSLAGDGSVQLIEARTFTIVYIGTRNDVLSSNLTTGEIAYATDTQELLIKQQDGEWAVYTP